MNECPACRNELKPRATACGHCGAYLARSPLTPMRQLAGLGWLLIGLFLIWALPAPTLGAIAAVVGALLLFWPAKPRWRHR